MTNTALPTADLARKLRDYNNTRKARGYYDDMDSEIIRQMAEELARRFPEADRAMHDAMNADPNDENAPDWVDALLAHVPAN